MNKGPTYEGMESLLIQKNGNKSAPAPLHVTSVPLSSFHILLLHYHSSQLSYVSFSLPLSLDRVTSYDFPVFSMLLLLLLLYENVNVSTEDVIIYIEIPFTLYAFSNIECT